MSGLIESSQWSFSMPFLGSGNEVLLLWPWALLMLVLPLLVKLLPKLVPDQGRALVVPAGSALRSATGEGQTQSQFSLARLLALFCWVFLVVAATRPQWQGAVVVSEVSGRDLMMNIDISGSMNEADMHSGNSSFSRIDVVRKVAADFIERRAGDRIGLIMFGSQAYVQTPLTLDHKTVAHFMSEAQVGLAGRSTAIGDAIGLAVKRLRDRPQESRVIVLLTDGANSAGVVDPLDAARVAAASDIRIHAIGVGAEKRAGTIFGMRVPAGRSELDEKTLLQIAEITGGEYFRARDPGELEKIYAALDEIEPTRTEQDQYRPRSELFPWPLSLALLLSFAVALLRLRVTS